MQNSIQTTYKGVDIPFASTLRQKKFEMLPPEEKDKYLEKIKHRKQLEHTKNAIVSVFIESELSIADIGLVLDELTNEHQSNIDKYLNATPASHCYQDIY